MNTKNIPKILEVAKKTQGQEVEWFRNHEIDKIGHFSWDRT
jgi:hypothetical protein